MLLSFEGIENFRDMGGLARSDGKVIRNGRLLRCGHLHWATDRDIARMEKMGIFSIVDFRDISERMRSPDCSVGDAENLHLPAMKNLGTLFEKGFGQLSAEQAHEGFCALYRYLAESEDSREAYAGFFECLLRSEGRPVIFHCTQGKDRTGIAAALLMTALGFDRDAVREEYLATNQALSSHVTATQIGNVSAERIAMIRELYMAFPENIDLYFECLKKKYGSAQAYLKKALGLGGAELMALEKYYMEELK